MLSFVFKRRHATARLSPEDCERFLGRLVFSMETRELFRNGELTLHELALAIALSPQQLAQLLKEACGSSFQDYLNRYRVEALKAALLCPKNASENIFDLAFACGFSSRSGLNRIFRKYAGVTPEQFRKQGGASGAAGGSSFATQ
jgi:AraC-like DNA-binding protein